MCYSHNTPTNVDTGIHQGLKCKCEGLGTVKAYGPSLFSCQAPYLLLGPRPPTMYKYTVHKLRNDTKFGKNASSSFITCDA